MPRFMTAQGELTTDTDTDPERLLWYSAQCGYWTDDWEKVGRAGPGIPCCPTCQSPGFQSEANKWLADAEAYEAGGHPRYADWVRSIKETCDGRTSPEKHMARYAAWLNENSPTTAPKMLPSTRNNITEQHLNDYRKRMREDFATPFLCMGVCHEPHRQGEVNLCVVEDFDKATIVAMLRRAADLIERGEAVDGDK